MFSSIIVFFHFIIDNCCTTESFRFHDILFFLPHFSPSNSFLTPDSIDDKTAVKLLSEARDSGVQLSARSTELLSFDSDNQGRINFIKEMKNVAYQQLTLITAMDTLKKDSDDLDALTMLVVGTDHINV